MQLHLIQSTIYFKVIFNYWICVWICSKRWFVPYLVIFLFTCSGMSGYMHVLKGFKYVWLSKRVYRWYCVHLWWVQYLEKKVICKTILLWTVLYTVQALHYFKNTYHILKNLLLAHVYKTSSIRMNAHMHVVWLKCTAVLVVNNYDHLYFYPITVLI